MSGAERTAPRRITRKTSRSGLREAEEDRERALSALFGAVGPDEMDYHSACRGLGVAPPLAPPSSEIDTRGPKRRHPGQTDERATEVEYRERRWGLTRDREIRLRAFQHGRCAICREPGKKLCVDHDHTTDAIRGLLCGPCNMRLGFFENPDARRKGHWKVEWERRARPYLADPPYARLQRKTLEPLL